MADFKPRDVSAARLIVEGNEEYAPVLSAILVIAQIDNSWYQITESGVSRLYSVIANPSFKEAWNFCLKSELLYPADGTKQVYHVTDQLFWIYSRYLE